MLSQQETILSAVISRLKLNATLFEHPILFYIYIITKAGNNVYYNDIYRSTMRHASIGANIYT